jgi:hypothetical protein
MQELWKKKKRSNSSQQDKKGKRWLVAILQSHPNIPCLMPAPALSARLSVIASPPAFFIRQARYLCSETTETVAGPYTYTTGPLCPDIGKNWRGSSHLAEWLRAVHGCPSRWRRRASWRQRRLLGQRMWTWCS